ncbi:sulfate ABC transporter substrate-binding protein [Geminocystis herdmanii]|uniref:sulfate ABC transporter substrate-binding protein n=1 Tax=Geminocystis herdmanii TaxID=669359 RepID=UPI00034CBD68|nr:sulfate ABC transporter substrate-binding protein [Geminocystis herdmanii]
MKKQNKLIKGFIIGLAISGVITACTNTNNTSTTTETSNQTSPKPEVKITLVSYAVTQAAYEKIIPQFAQEWEEKTGQKVVVEQSYGGSGSQTRAVIDGLEADVVGLALSADTLKIQQAGLIEPGWEQEVPNNGIVTRSVVALVSREGGKTANTWADLANPDIKVITANPKTSGGARWNFLVLWGAITQSGGDAQKAEEFVTSVYKNVPVLPKDAREATDVFYKQGQGDILMNYENEILLAKLKGETQPYVIPTDKNISIDGPIAVVDKYVDKRGTREVAEAFVQFLYTPEAQRAFAEVGFRPVDEAIFEEFKDQYPKVDNLFTVEAFGGWDQVQKDFFDDGAVFDRIFANLRK